MHDIKVNTLFITKTDTSVRLSSSLNQYDSVYAVYYLMVDHTLTCDDLKIIYYVDLHVTSSVTGLRKRTISLTVCLSLLV